jgi:hypothetical protein
MATVSTLDRFLDPVMSCFTPQVAKNLVELRLDPELTARIEYLANRANEGTISPDEDEEYKDYIEGGDVVALLQAKARRFLMQHGQ